jgi:MFS family permease
VAQACVVSLAPSLLGTRRVFNFPPGGLIIAGMTMLTEPAADWSPRSKALLAVLCAALFLDSMDVSMVGIALPSIRADLGLSTSTLQWVVSGYVLGYGGFLLLGGRAADLLGRREMFLGSLVVFTVATVVGGVVSSGALLIASRFVKGVAAAFTAPAGMSLITTTFREGAARNRALSIYTSCAAAGFSLGLVLSGLLTELSWRATFLFPAPLALAALAGGALLVPRGPATGRPSRGYDLPGAVTATAALLLLVLTLTDAQRVGWGSARTLGSLVVVAALLAAFAWIEQHQAAPLLRLGLLSGRAVLASNLAAFAFQGSYMGFQFILTLYLQRLLGWSPLDTALAILPTGALVGLVAPRLGPVIGRVGTSRLLVIGFCALAACYANMLRIGAHGDYAGVVLPSMLLVGLSFALAFPCINIAATSRVPDAEQGMASGLVNASFQIGAAVGLAAATAVVVARTSGGTGGQIAGYHAGLVASLAIALLGLLVVIVLELAERVPGEARSATAEAS